LKKKPFEKKFVEKPKIQLEKEELKPEIKKELPFKLDENPEKQNEQIKTRLLQLELSPENYTIQAISLDDIQEIINNVEPSNIIQKQRYSLRQVMENLLGDVAQQFGMIMPSANEDIPIFVSKNINSDDMFDVIIVGAGLTGTSTAYHLSEKKLKILKKLLLRFLFIINTISLLFELFEGSYFLIYLVFLWNLYLFFSRIILRFLFLFIFSDFYFFLYFKIFIFF